MTPVHNLNSFHISSLLIRNSMEKCCSFVSCVISANEGLVQPGTAVLYCSSIGRICISY